MTKFKVVLLLVLTVVLFDFALENPLPPPEIKFFKFTLGQVPTYLLAYISLAVGLLLGWFAHARRLRKKRRRAAQALAQAQQAQNQQGQETSR